eukprot:TRINITY_DN408_c0_g2_i1.p1 TRINITY_DN408_c0_g2~~TRINITY_DN408_c0_g2_i1.p1  ORF type:complete len:315 (+),score=34.28 TRINITY_DN408_c0_g2_i1:65-946(+)
MGPPGPGAPTPLFSRSFEVGGRDTPIDCVCARDVPVESIASAFADLQSENPILGALHAQHHDRMMYGRFLAKHCCGVSSIAAVTSASPERVVGLLLGMDCDPCALNASMLPPSVAAHWALCITLAGQVHKRLKVTPSARKKGHPERRILYSVFGGVVTDVRGSGLFPALQNAHRNAARSSGATHSWGFTFSTAVIKGALSPGSPYLDGPLAVLAGPLRAAGPQLFEGLPAPVLQATIAAFNLFHIVPRRIMTWAHPVSAFRYDGRRPLAHMAPSVLIVSVLRLNDPSWPESRL